MSSSLHKSKKSKKSKESRRRPQTSASSGGSGSEAALEQPRDQTPHKALRTKKATMDQRPTRQSHEA